MTSDMLSWTRKQIEVRKALAEAVAESSGPAWHKEAQPQDSCNIAVVASGTAYVLDCGSDHIDHRRELAEHVAFNDPRQVIADCEADLVLLEFHSHRVWDVCRGCGLKAPCWTARTLAARYRHRPGYQPSWAPEGVTP